MKSNPPPDLPMAMAGLVDWFSSVRAGGGYTGPAVAFRSNCLAWCGPAPDWRLEGLFEAHARMFQSTGQSVWLDMLGADISCLLDAQLGDGAFRNSYFEWNPFEGGMPHEPAVLAEALRARRVLAAAGRDVPGLADAVVRLLDGRLLRLLWNKSLKTVRDWEITDFEFGQAVSAAATLDLILEWTAWQGNVDRYAPFIDGLVAWLLKLQKSEGDLAGGILSSNRRGSGISPFHTARCLGPLRRHARATGSEKSAGAADMTSEFLLRQHLPGGGFRRLLWSWRPSSSHPMLVGAQAAVLNALHDDGKLSSAELSRHQAWMLAMATPGGAFRNAIGYGKITPEKGLPDWRDHLPCPGWQDKVLAFLARGMDGKSLPAFRREDYSLPVKVNGKAGTFEESGTMLRILRGTDPVFLWRKKEDWPELCLLT